MDTRGRILDAARDLYLEEGRAAVTMRAVAERVGVTATALYRHFHNKDALITEVIDEGFRTFASYLYRALEGPDPGARLRLAGEAYLEFGLEHPEFYRTIFMAEGRARAPGEEDMQSSATFRFLKDRVAECVDAGVLEPAPPEDLALTIWAHTHGLVSLFISGALPMDEDEFRSVYGRSLHDLIAGLAA